MKKKILIFCKLLLLSFFSYAQHAAIPSPKATGQNKWVSDPDYNLSASTISQLDTILQHLDEDTQVEFAIVVVDNFNGDDVFDFSLNLFNTWGIGKKDLNTGLLLFIAKDRRSYQFISGYGMEGLFPDIFLKRVGEKYLVPNFREGNYNKGILEAVEFIEKVLRSPDSVSELQQMMPEAIPFWSLKSPILEDAAWWLLILIIVYVYVHVVTTNLLKDEITKVSFFGSIFFGMGCMLALMFISIFPITFLLNNLDYVYKKEHIPYFIAILATLIITLKITDGRDLIIKTFKDEEDIDITLRKYLRRIYIPLLLTPIAWIDWVIISKRLNGNIGRFTPPNNDIDWERIKRSNTNAQTEKFLNNGQHKEESLKSRRYEIWQNTKTQALLYIPWNITNKFGRCPQCKYYTLLPNQNKTIYPATYTREGKGEKFNRCEYCNHIEHVSFYTIDKKTRSSTTHSSSGGGSSSGGSSSSSGSFGGGSSGGGGAGGRW